MASFYARQLFDGKSLHENARMIVDEGTISSIDLNNSVKTRDDIYLDGLVTAGFIDTQVNGGGGSLFNHDPSIAALIKMINGHGQFGTTALLPTLITDNTEKMHSAAYAVAQAIDAKMQGIVGIHFEGPHLSLTKKGIHPGNHVRAITDRDLALFQRKDIGKVLLTIAPETVPVDVIRELISSGVTVSLGHSGASIECVLQAIDAGATGFTHLFNAMSGITAREPGMIAAALVDKRVTAGLIADLHHVHPYNCNLAFESIGPERLMLVTDAMAHVGSSLHSIPWQDGHIIRDGSKLTLENGSLAGSCLDMASAVRNMHHVVNGQLESILNMASSVPGRFLGLDHLGELQVGKRANFVVLNEQIQVQAVWIEGQKIECKDVK